MTSEVCPSCGKTFVPKKRKPAGTARYCSRQCQLAKFLQQPRPREVRVCETCRRPFLPRPWSTRRGLGRFCSRSCFSKVAVQTMLRKVRARKPRVGDHTPCPTCGDLVLVSVTRARDGRYACVRCVAVRARQTRDKRRDDFNARLRTRRRSDEFRARARQQQAAARRTQKGQARYLVSRALQAGEVVRELCETCGERRGDAHHDDYSRPLDVRWLCRRCHGVIHRKYREADHVDTADLSAAHR